MKIGVSSYSFQQLINSGDETQLSIISKAKEMGFDGIEFIDLNVPEGMTEEEYSFVLKAESDRVGIPIIAYTIGANLLCDEGLDAEVERVCKKIDIAANLGAKVLRHDAAWNIPDSIKSYSGFDQVLPILAEGCKRITEYAKSKNIVTCIENHGFFCQDSSRVEKIVTTVADENFGVLIDIGNFCCADENSAQAVGNLAAYAKHIHAKDFHIKSGNGLNPGDGFFKSRSGNYLRGSIIGHGDIPVYQCLNILKEKGYDGWVSVEFEGLENCIKGIEIGFKNLKKYISLL